MVRQSACSAPSAWLQQWEAHSEVVLCAGARFQKLLPVVLQRLEGAPVHHVVSAHRLLCLAYLALYALRLMSHLAESV